MHIAIAKTKVLHAREQDPISKTTPDEARAVCKFHCPHLHCNHYFVSKRGLHVHQAKCKWKDEFAVDQIINHKGPTTNRKYLIRWENYSHEWDSWVPRSNLHPDTIKDYETETGCYVHGWQATPMSSM